MDMLIYWAPLLIIFFGMIILGLVKHNNKKLCAISIAWLSLIMLTVSFVSSDSGKKGKFRGLSLLVVYAI